MASPESVILALLVHLIIRCMLFITTTNTPGPVLPTVIVCLAALDVICHTILIPERFEDMSDGFKYVFEAMMAVILLQVAMLLWHSIEHTVYLTAKTSLVSMRVISKETYSKQENLIIGAFTLPMSLAIFIATTQTYSTN